MRVVVDTNVLVSSFLTPKGHPRAVIDLWKTGQISLCVSEEILEEYLEVLARLGLRGEPELKNLLRMFKRKENLVFRKVAAHFHRVKEDPADDKFIDCAIGARARYIISGDSHLLKVKQFKTVKIVSPVQFVAQMK
ncbi:MAG: putative toxin-antitoxin system toxin component, PIN family [Spirochaetia bacterium]